jgi:hypothetical protein
MLPGGEDGRIVWSSPVWRRKRMRVVAGLAALFILGSIPALAQNSQLPTTTVPDALAVQCFENLLPDNGKHEKGSTVTGCKTSVIEGCPVDMRVRQRMGGGTVAVDKDGSRRQVFAQRLRLILNSVRQGEGDRKAVSATVMVHGTGAKARMQSLRSGPVSNSMVRTFEVDLAHWDEPGVSGEFLLPGFTSASQVDLDSVTYEDGTTWKLSRNHSCRVAPDPLMLIDK